MGEVDFEVENNYMKIISPSIGFTQVEGAPEGITSDEEKINFIASLDIPITDKINLIGQIGYF